MLGALIGDLCILISWHWRMAIFPNISNHFYFKNPRFLMHTKTQGLQPTCSHIHIVAHKHVSDIYSKDSSHRQDIWDFSLNARSAPNNSSFCFFFFFFSMLLLTGSMKRNHLVFNAASDTEWILEVTRHMLIVFI